jgi:hypothetical protein
MHPALSILTPQCIATEAFTNATAAVARLDEIYERNTAFLRDCFGAHANGETISTRVRATYPFRPKTIAQEGGIALIDLVEASDRRSCIGKGFRRDALRDQDAQCRARVTRRP